MTAKEIINYFVYSVADMEILVQVFPEWVKSEKSFYEHYTELEALDRIRGYIKNFKEGTDESDSACRDCAFLPYCEKSPWNSVDELIDRLDFRMFLADFCECSEGCNSCIFGLACVDASFPLAMLPDVTLKGIFLKYAKCQDFEKDKGTL